MNLCTAATPDKHLPACKYYRSLTFAYLWYEGTEHHGRIINICRWRESLGIPDVFG